MTELTPTDLGLGLLTEIRGAVKYHMSKLVTVNLMGWYPGKKMTDLFLALAAHPLKLDGVLLTETCWSNGSPYRNVIKNRLFICYLTEGAGVIIFRRQ